MRALLEINRADSSRPETRRSQTKLQNAHLSNNKHAGNHFGAHFRRGLARRDAICRQTFCFNRDVMAGERSI